jgi:hypothetical protein
MRGGERQKVVHSAAATTGAAVAQVTEGGRRPIGWGGAGPKGLGGLGWPDVGKEGKTKRAGWAETRNWVGIMI